MKQTSSIRGVTLVEANDDTWEAHRRKRFNVVRGFKESPEYRAYAQSRPHGRRSQGDPSTPNPAEPMGNKKWDAVFAKWKRDVREWPSKRGG